MSLLDPTRGLSFGRENFGHYSETHHFFPKGPIMENMTDDIILAALISAPLMIMIGLLFLAQIFGK